jgi:hypothetical protein
MKPVLGLTFMAINLATIGAIGAATRAAHALCCPLLAIHDGLRPPGEGQHQPVLRSWFIANASGPGATKVGP